MGIEVTDKFCEGCVLDKQHRKNLETERKPKHPGDQIHMNLYGPLYVTSLVVEGYFLLIKDDFSQYKYVIFLKEKSEVTRLMKFG